jgi:hypothetical protein
MMSNFKVFKFQRENLEIESEFSENCLYILRGPKICEITQSTVKFEILEI